MSRFNLLSAPRFLMGLALCLGLAAQSHAAPITGDPVGNSFGWTPNSTNSLNYTLQVPGRVGQVAPYVLFSSNTAGSVILDFFNFGPGLAFFETRIDGIATGATNHPVVTGDTIHTGGTALATQTQQLGKVFTAVSFVDIRLALGGERDWDFDWVRFEVAPTGTVPVPATLGLMLFGLLGLAARRRRS